VPNARAARSFRRFGATIVASYSHARADKMHSYAEQFVKHWPKQFRIAVVPPEWRLPGVGIRAVTPPPPAALAPALGRRVHYVEFWDSIMHVT
jgi:hypothetical protein